MVLQFRKNCFIPRIRMHKQEIKIAELIAFLGDELIRVEGTISDAFIDNLADVEHINEHTLDWVIPTKQDKISIIERSRAKVVLVDPEVHYTESLRQKEKILLCVNNPKRALAKVGNRFFVNKPTPCIHPTAIIHPEAKLGDNVYVGAYTVIGHAIIGDECIIDSCVKINDNVICGKHCVIKSGAVLGGEGFGFERDADGNLFRFPQIGRLIIGDDVEIGANTCIDRGALSDTIIGDHTKINNLCHIAHNNKIGKNVVITGCVNVSGSNVIEDNVWIAPNATIRGFVHLSEGCTVGMGAVVTKDIPSGETWVGNPAKKLK